MFCCRAAAVLAINDPGDFNSNLAQRRMQLESTTCADLQTIYGKGCDGLTLAQKSNYEMRVAKKILLQNPFAFLKLAFRGSAVMLLDGDPSSLQGMTGINPHLGIRLLLIYTGPALCLAALGLWGIWGKNRQLFYLCFLTIAYFLVVSSGGDSYSRHRVPIVPVYAILIAAGVDVIFNRRISRPDSTPPDSRVPSEPASTPVLANHGRISSVRSALLSWLAKDDHDRDHQVRPRAKTISQ